MARNLVTFGVPFFSTETYDAWVTKWEPPDENIYRLMATICPIRAAWLDSDLIA